MVEREEGAEGKATGGPESGCRSSREQPGAARTGTGSGALLPTVDERWGTEPRGVAGSEAISLKFALPMQVGPAKSVQACLVGWGRSWCCAPSHST